MIQTSANRVNTDKGIPEIKMSVQSELERLGMNRRSDREAELGSGLEEEREGVEIRRKREVAHTREEEEGGERGGEEGMSPDDVVEGKG